MVNATESLPVELQALVERVALALQQEGMKFTTSAAMPKIAAAALQFTQVIDPGNQLLGYQGVWRNARNDRCGVLTINSDHSVYAEYDLFCPHPRDERWLVEMVTAWGREDNLRSEATLIPNM